MEYIMAHEWYRIIGYFSNPVAHHQPIPKRNVIVVVVKL